MRVAAGVLGAALVALAPAVAHAQGVVSEYSDLTDETVIESPVWGVWELLAVGPYQPDAIGDVGSSLEGLADDRGPLLATELDFFIFHIPYVGPVGAGVRAGWAKFDGPAFDERTGEPSENRNTKVTIFPITPMAVLRVNVLARELDFPVIFTGKIGLHMIPWRSSTGGRSDGSDIEFGLRWAAQVALELDFLEPRAARMLDEEWGINHSFIFGEVFGSTASGGFGDSFAWAAGLGFVF